MAWGIHVASARFRPASRRIVVRIIAGRFRGRVLSSPTTSHIRPTANRVKEAWMSIVQPEIPDSRVLDLFAGSGSLGLEALSRGAIAVDFVEHSRSCVETIRKNVAMLRVDGECVIHIGKVMAFVTALDTDAYDIAFADPPYDSAGGMELVRAFRSKPFAKILGVEHRAATSIPGDRTTNYGDIALTFCFAP